MPAIVSKVCEGFFVDPATSDKVFFSCVSRPCESKQVMPSWQTTGADSSSEHQKTRQTSTLDSSSRRKRKPRPQTEADRSCDFKRCDKGLLLLLRMGTACAWTLEETHRLKPKDSLARLQPKKLPFSWPNHTSWRLRWPPGHVCWKEIEKVGGKVKMIGLPMCATHRWWQHCQTTSYSRSNWFPWFRHPCFRAFFSLSLTMKWPMLGDRFLRLGDLDCVDSDDLIGLLGRDKKEWLKIYK